MPLIRDARTKPIRCPGHTFDDLPISRCPTCGIVNDRSDYGFTQQSGRGGVPIGSPHIQLPKVKGIFGLKAGDNALPLNMSLVKSPKTGRKGWISPDLGKNPAKGR